MSDYKSVFTDPLFFLNCLSAILSFVCLKYLAPKPDEVIPMINSRNSFRWFYCAQLILSLVLAFFFMYLCMRFGDLQIEKLKASV